MYNYLVKFFRNVTMSFFTAIFVIALAGVTCRDGIMKVSSFYVQGGISFSAVFELLLLPLFWHYAICFWISPQYFLQCV